MWHRIVLERVRDLAISVGGELLSYEHVSNDALSTRDKSNKTPITEADQLANDKVVAGLRYLTPTWPIISEEESIPPFDERKHWDTFWLIDPLDGTRGFLESRSEYTVNIALIHRNRPVMGVVYAPAEKRCYYAAKGLGSFACHTGGAEQQLNLAKHQAHDPLRLTLGRYTADASWRDRLSSHLPAFEITTLNSSLKICCLADGSADLYPRAGNISEWDVAAADCILTEAGGAIFDSQKNPLRYNSFESILCPSFVALANPADWDRLNLGALLAD